MVKSLAGVHTHVTCLVDTSKTLFHNAIILVFRGAYNERALIALNRMQLIQILGIYFPNLLSQRLHLCRILFDIIFTERLSAFWVTVMSAFLPKLVVQ